MDTLITMETIQNIAFVESIFICVGCLFIVCALTVVFAHYLTTLVYIYENKKMKEVTNVKRTEGDNNGIQ